MIRNLTFGWGPNSDGGLVINLLGVSGHPGGFHISGGIKVIFSKDDFAFEMRNK